jgi:hypothetical protein
MSPLHEPLPGTHVAHPRFGTQTFGAQSFIALKPPFPSHVLATVPSHKIVPCAQGGAPPCPELEALLLDAAPPSPELEALLDALALETAPP